jgi:hypothetical protein
MSTLSKRREELLQRCRHERNQLIASSATTIAQIPHAQDLRRWIRLARRILNLAHPGASHASH